MLNRAYLLLLTVNLSVAFFNQFALLFDSAFSNHEKEYRYYGWPAPLTKDLHPLFRLVYQVAETAASLKRPDGGRKLAIPGFPSLNLDLTNLTFYPEDTAFLSKVNIVIPVRNAGMYKSAFNWDLFVNVPIKNILTKNRRKRRNLSKEHFKREKRKSKLRLFSQLEEALRGANIRNEDNTTSHIQDDDYNLFLKAELHGKTRKCINKYSSGCETSIFDLLSLTENN